MRFQPARGYGASYSEAPPREGLRFCESAACLVMHCAAKEAVAAGRHAPAGVMVGTG